MGRAIRTVGQTTAIAVVLGLLAVLVWRIVQDRDGGAAAALRRGDSPTAPSFVLERLDRRGTLDLESLRGRTVVLNFWASWCLPCKREAPLLERAWQRWRSRGVTVVGIDANDLRSDARRFMRRYGITYPVVYDGPGEWLDDYGLTGFPETFFVRPDGTIASWTQGELDAKEIEAGIVGALPS